MYDIQKIRIQIGNRISTNFRVKLGQEPGEKTETIDKENQKILLMVMKEHRRLTDAIASTNKRKIVDALKKNEARRNCQGPPGFQDSRCGRCTASESIALVSCSAGCVHLHRPASFSRLTSYYNGTTLFHLIEFQRIPGRPTPDQPLAVPPSVRVVVMGRVCLGPATCPASASSFLCCCASDPSPWRRQ